MSSFLPNAKGPKGEQAKESLLPTAVAGYQRGMAVAYGADAYHAILVGAAAQAIGILEENAIDVRNPCAVIEFGQAIAQIGANVTMGQALATDEMGRLVPAVSTNPIIAIALETQNYAAPGAFACVWVTGSFGAIMAP